MTLTSGQCRAARALLDWTQDDLAERAEVSRSTVRGFEGGQHELQRSTGAAIRRALEEAGIVILERDGTGGEGVRLRCGRPQPRPESRAGRSASASSGALAKASRRWRSWPGPKKGPGRVRSPWREARVSAASSASGAPSGRRR